MYTRIANACSAVGLPGYTDENLAWNKPATQSSTYQDKVASYAVDGDHGECSCTNYNDPHEWLSVDLQTAHDIAHVTVMNDDSLTKGDYPQTCSAIVNKNHR